MIFLCSILSFFFLQVVDKGVGRADLTRVVLFYTLILQLELLLYVCNIRPSTMEASWIVREARLFTTSLAHISQATQQVCNSTIFTRTDWLPPYIWAFHWTTECIQLVLQYSSWYFLNLLKYNSLGYQLILTAYIRRCELSYLMRTCRICPKLH